MNNLFQSLQNGHFEIIAGPCSIESMELIHEIAPTLQAQGIRFFRGGLYKMRTSPDAFQGPGELGIEWILEFKKKYPFQYVVEISDPRNIPLLSKVADVFQVGSRSMYQYSLLTELGKLSKPVLLKRAFSATIDEWIKAARYIEKEGNQEVILCERGIRTFDDKLRNTLDLGAVAYLKKETHYPVVVDPSHAAGRADLVPALSFAAKAVGANGLIVEVHPRPQEALSDGPQSLTLEAFQKMKKQLERMEY